MQCKKLNLDIIPLSNNICINSFSWFSIFLGWDSPTSTIAFFSFSRVFNWKNSRLQSFHYYVYLFKEHWSKLKKHILVTLTDEEEIKKNQNVLVSLFNWKNLKSSWVALLRKRDGRKRMIIILLILAFELEIFLTVGKWSSSFLFFRKHLKWTEIEYSR